MRLNTLLWILLFAAVGLFPGNAEGQVEYPVPFRTSGEGAMGIHSPQLLEYTDTGTEQEEGFSPEFFKSALVPGWGQLSQGKYLRAAVFVGIEFAGIAGHIVYRQKFQDWKEKYETHAREYWHLERWLQFYDPNTDPRTHNMPVKCPGEETEWHYPTQSGAIPCDPANWEVIWNHEAYENAYKYDQFMAGWYDADNPDRGYDPSDPDSALANKLSPLRAENKRMRVKANQMAEYARTFAFTLMANHAIAAFEALLFAPDRTAESRRARFDLRFQPGRFGDQHTGLLQAEYRW